MKIIDCQQGTDEWRQARCGIVTASRIYDIMSKGKGSAESASRRDYRSQLVAEILTRVPQESGFMNDAMKWGTENEMFARAAYEVATSSLVDQVGMVMHPWIERAGASPDGILHRPSEPRFLVEIKCPNTATHIEYLLNESIPMKYQYQMLWQMACCEADGCDFVSFDPRLDSKNQLAMIVFRRDEKRINEIEDRVTEFLSEVDEMVSRISNRA